MQNSLRWLAVLGSVVLIAGCSTTSLKQPATVVDKSTYNQPTAAQQAYLDAQAARRAQLASGESYTVRQGDTLYSIAMRHGMSVEQLKELNNITDPTQLHPGQVLSMTKSVRSGVDNNDFAGSEVRVTPITVHRAQSPVPSVSSAAQDKLQSARQDVNDKVESAKTEVARQTETAREAVKPSVGGRMIWPVKGKVASGFKDNGKGLDIRGTKGDVVVAAMDGDVLFVGVVKGYGNLVIVKHSPTLVTAYGNNDRIVVSTGKHVSAGQKIAEVGDANGNAELRFEVREKGHPVDPMQYLPR